MADIELVIKIPEEDFKRFGYEYSEEHCISKHTNETILNAFCNGTILLKGHGRLIDADKLIKWLKLYNDCYNKRFAKTPIKDIPMYDLGHRNRNDDVISNIDSFLTIIEADKEVEE